MTETDTKHNQFIKFSVLMAIYSGTKKEYLIQALQSVINQTRPADEHVLIIDGPLTPDVDDLINRLSTSKLLNGLKIVRIPTNLGLGNALHEGIKECSGDFILRMDDDDISVKNRFQQHYDAIVAHPQTDVFGGQILEFSSVNRPTIRRVPLQHREIKRWMGLRNTMNHVTVCMRRKAVLSAGNYDKKSAGGFEDYELWQRMLAAGFRFTNSEEPLAYVRFDFSQLQRRSGLKYLIEELRVHFSFFRQRQISLAVFLVSANIRIFFRLAPLCVLVRTYKLLMRQQPDNQATVDFDDTFGQSRTGRDER